MSRSVIHKHVSRTVSLGGTPATLNTTLCGRSAPSQWDKNDGLNVSCKNSEVTCKFCLRIMKVRGMPNE